LVLDKDFNEALRGGIVLKPSEGVIIAAERFHHELTVEFGVLSYECANENEYLKNAIELIKELKEIKKYEMEEIFTEKVPTIKSFHNALDSILLNIERVMKIPENKRTYDM